MRAARLVLLALLVAPVGAATPAEPAWRFEGAVISGGGAVGEHVTLALRARLPPDAALVLEAPAWLRVEPLVGDAPTWRLTPTREGFWVVTARLAAPWNVTLCACAWGHAGGAGGRVAAEPGGVLPVAGLASTVDVAPGDAPAVRRVASVPGDAPRGVEVRAWSTPGWAYACAWGECAVDMTRRPRGPAAEEQVALRPDAAGRVVATLWSDATLPFEAAGGEVRPYVAEAACENVELAREGAGWRLARRWACFGEPPARVPGPGAGAALLVLVAAARLARRR